MLQVKVVVEYDEEYKKDIKEIKKMLDGINQAVSDLESEQGKLVTAVNGLLTRVGGLSPADQATLADDVSRVRAVIGGMQAEESSIEPPAV